MLLFHSSMNIDARFSRLKVYHNEVLFNKWCIGVKLYRSTVIIIAMQYLMTIFNYQFVNLVGLAERLGTRS